jgi:uncharacterized protein
VTTGAVIIVLVVSLGAAISQTAAGFGFALLATPILSLVIEPALAVIVVNVVATPLGWIRYAHERHDIDRPLAKRLVLWSLLGMPLGLVVQNALPANGLRLTIGAVVVVLAIAIAAGWRLKQSTVRTDAMLGFVSGVLSTATATNGPPLVVAIDSRHPTPAVFRATLVAIFVPTGFVSLALFWVNGNITATGLALSAVGFPAMLAGNQIGRRAAPLLSPATFRRLLIALLLASGTSAIVKSLF